MLRSSLRQPPSHQTIYPAPAVSQSTAMVMGTMVPSRQLYTRDLQPGAVQSTPPYLGTSVGYALGSAPPPQFSSQSFWGSYGGVPHGAPSHQFAQSPQGSSYHYSLFPRTSPRENVTSESASIAYIPGLQLPPIRPAPAGTVTEPALAQQRRISAHPTQGSPQPPATNSMTGQRDAKRPRMDIQGILD